MKNSLLTLCCVVLVSSMAAISAYAAGGVTHPQHTWDGGGADDLWMTLNNWGDNTQPSNGDALYFAGTARLSPINDYAPMTFFNSLNFNPTAGSPFTLSG
ncbi:MAG TPA: hypothetical protein P5287_07825, partial [bacterium]|nr:hypothetical protein [bacterium]